LRTTCSPYDRWTVRNVAVLLACSIESELNRLVTALRDKRPSKSFGSHHIALIATVNPPLSRPQTSGIAAEDFTRCLYPAIHLWIPDNALLSNNII
jgi:hypothetical protein